MAILAGFFLPHPTIAIPEIGDGLEDSIFSTTNSMNKVAERIAFLKPDTIIFISAHAESYSDYFQLSDGEVALGSLAKYGASDINFRIVYDRKFVSELSQYCSEIKIPCGINEPQESFLDYGTTIPLYFINPKWSNYSMVRLGVSGLSLIDHYRLGNAIRRISNQLGRRCVVIASGNLSHSSDVASIPENGFEQKYDRRIKRLLENANFLDLFYFPEDIVSKAKQCAHRPLTILAGTLDRYGLDTTLYSFENKTGTTLAVAGFEVRESDSSRAFGELYLTKQAIAVNNARKTEDKYAKLARETIEHYLLTGKNKTMSMLSDSDLKNRNAGVFIKLYKNGCLRGCMGSVKPVAKSLGEGIISMALKAAFEDKRFAPITKDDLRYLEVEVLIVKNLRPARNENELDPSMYGLVVEDGLSHATLLPNLPAIQTADEQITLAKRKASIPVLNRCRMYIFEVERH